MDICKMFKVIILINIMQSMGANARKKALRLKIFFLQIQNATTIEFLGRKNYEAKSKDKEDGIKHYNSEQKQLLLRYIIS